MKLNQSNKVKMTTLLAVVIPSVILLVSFSTDNKKAFAGQDMAIDITNNLQDEDLIFNKVENRQDVKIKSDPPSEVKALQSGGFKIAKGDSEKNPHLKLQYYVGEKGSSETVTFGFKGTWSDLNCFTETPSDIKGSHENCHDANKKFFFSPN